MSIAQIITGATGSLGSHLLHLLTSSSPEAVTKVVCLVRGADDRVAEDRVRRALEHRKLSYASHRVQVLAARLGKPNLGLREDTYSDLARDADIVIHVSPSSSLARSLCLIYVHVQAAWAVHFGSRLESFEKDHILGEIPSRQLYQR